MRSTRDKLLMSLSELQQFVMILIQSAQAQTTNNPAIQGPTTNQITAQIIEKQKNINEIIKVRYVMRNVKGTGGIRGSKIIFDYSEISLCDKEDAKNHMKNIVLSKTLEW